MDFQSTFDVIVVGGGHAGVEAALAAARMGAQTLLITQSLETIGQMSCNPAIGGIGKSHLVREIDALGGVMARAADAAGIHWRTLNASKGPAVQATRAQADRALYKQHIRRVCENQPGLSLFAQGVNDLIVEQGVAVGVVTELGLRLRARAVILTVGTFLAGRIHVGERQHPGGRAGERAAIPLAQRLRALGLPVGRLKTGTPPRIDGRSIDYSGLAKQPSEWHGQGPWLSMQPTGNHPDQVVCHIAHTNVACHDIIRNNMHRSAIHAGEITGAGPRYCPSIEDKIQRFADKDRHQIFIEPEGLQTHEVYPNGISTSLPFEVQVAFLRAIPGFEKAHITRPGYAIAYDFFDPRALHAWLETHAVKGLFFAGQINGTTGYEEAGAQGLLAGINAVLLQRGEAAWVPRRDEAYMGVMVDDLVTQGAMEPYRMFTSRAEWRLLLRQDNADVRLTEIGHRLGVVDDVTWQRYQAKRAAVQAELTRLAKHHVGPESACRDALGACLAQAIDKSYALADLLKRPKVSYATLMEAVGLPPVPADIADQVTIETRYAGYIARQAVEVGRLREQERVPIPSAFDFSAVKGLSAEITEKLTKLRPSTLGQASRAPGMTPAALSLLLVYLKKQGAHVA